MPPTFHPSTLSSTLNFIVFAHGVASLPLQGLLGSWNVRPPSCVGNHSFFHLTLDAIFHLMSIDNKSHVTIHSTCPICTNIDLSLTNILCNQYFLPIYYLLAILFFKVFYHFLSYSLYLSRYMNKGDGKSLKSRGVRILTNYMFHVLYPLSFTYLMPHQWHWHESQLSFTNKFSHYNGFMSLFIKLVS